MASSHYTEVTRVFLTRFEKEMEGYDGSLAAIARKRCFELAPIETLIGDEQIDCCRACGCKKVVVKTVDVHGHGTETVRVPHKIHLLKCDTCKRVTKSKANSKQRIAARMETGQRQNMTMKPHIIDTNVGKPQDPSILHHKTSGKQRARMRKDKSDLKMLLQKRTLDGRNATSSLSLRDFLNV